MQATVNLSKPDSLIADITIAAHGLTFPAGLNLMAAYITALGVVTPANASILTSTKGVFVTAILDANTIRTQTSGFLSYAAHGLTVGDYYYVTDTGDGSFSSTPGTINDVSFLAFDDNNLLLIDNRPV